MRGRLGLPGLALLAPVGVPLDVGLARASDPQRARGNVLADHVTGARVGVVADAHRGNECGVDADLDPGADRGAVLAVAVVVGGDRAGADVRRLTDIGIADVGQVGNLAAGPDVGVLDLDERARLGPLPQDGARPQICERADAVAVAHTRLVDVGVNHRRVVADARVDQGRVRTDLAAVADPGWSVQTGGRRGPRV